MVNLRPSEESHAEFTVAIEDERAKVPPCRGRLGPKPINYQAREIAWNRSF
jgi:hypothetical protein